MNRASLRERLRAEVDRWASKSYSELVSLTYPVVYDAGTAAGDSGYQVEVTLLEKTPEYVDVAVAVSAGGLSVFLPVAENIVVRAPGQR